MPYLALPTHNFMCTEVSNNWLHLWCLKKNDDTVIHAGKTGKTTEGWLQFKCSHCHLYLLWGCSCLGLHPSDTPLVSDDQPYAWSKTTWLTTCPDFPLCKLNGLSGSQTTAKSAASWCCAWFVIRRGYPSSKSARDVTVPPWNRCG